MRANLEWLKEYLDGDIDAEKARQLFNNHSYEVESINKEGGFDILEIDILPNRASDSLCHRGIAKELSTISGLPFKDRELKSIDFSPTNLVVEISNPKKCPRYIGRIIKNIEVKDSPSWLQEKLKSIGQRPINNIVDSLNYVMFDMGQPMHAFDMDKSGQVIYVQEARGGEKMLTLDNRNLEILEGDLLITNGKEVLALAGVKGGKLAEVTKETKNIILESANFSSEIVRSSSRRLNLITDASKRYENGLTPELALTAIERATALIMETAKAKDTLVQDMVDVYPKKRKPYYLGVSSEEVNSLLGTVLKDNEIEDIIEKLNFDYRISEPLKEVSQKASDYIGKPYIWGASVSYDAPDKFDCSSFVSYLYANAGVSVPRMTVDQFLFGYEIEKSDLLPGDVIFSDNSSKDGGETAHGVSKEFMPGIVLENNISHNGIYLGDGNVIHASGKWYKGEVVLEKLDESPAFSEIRGYRRMAAVDEKRFVVKVPEERLDLRIKEDLIEEIGRIYGLNKIKSVLPSNQNNSPEINPTLNLIEKIKDILMGIGFDEVRTYSFSEEGEVELENPISKELPYMRSNLTSGLEKSLNLNIKNSELLGLDEIKIFEIGKVFDREGERLSLALGVIGKNKKSGGQSLDTIKKAIELLPEELGPSKIKEIEKGAIAELEIKETKRKDTASSYEFEEYSFNGLYSPISPYPYILRDIAVWLPADSSPEDLLNIIQREAGNILKRADLFDKFEKEGKVSYAYHLVFQSDEKTLTDEEINLIMDKIVNEANSRDWEVR